jgi:hypothetical protein
VLDRRDQSIQFELGKSVFDAGQTRIAREALPPTVTANTVGQLDAVTEFGQSAHTNQRIARTFDDGPDRVSQPLLSVLIRDNEICGWLAGCVHAVQAESHDLRVTKEAEGCFLVPGLKRP